MRRLRYESVTRLWSMSAFWRVSGRLDRFFGEGLLETFARSPAVHSGSSIESDVPSNLSRFFMLGMVPARNRRMSCNNLLETNRRLASPLGTGQQFGRAFHARSSDFGGGRSANRYDSSRKPGNLITCHG